MNNEPLRPDPDRLLEQTAAPHRGKLKVFFGACAGVGKTWAMLAEAQRLRAQGLDIVVGVVETHGRKDTAAMLEGLAVLPPKRQAYRGRHISEFDLDAALARRPALILMDELAHSNAPGSRHPKRWQDIEELLEAGIDVFTTVNVQHLESLNDVVSGVTGIQVRETVPDPFFDAADDVVLVDLPPDDLRQRLKEGKVYIAGQAERAIEHFFRKGNLIALRELALRRTADRVDEQMRAWRGHPGEEKVWHTRDAILLCIGHNTGSEKLVRAAARLASRLGSVWHAVYVETPALHRLPEKKRRAILSALRLAQELGAETATLSDPAEEKAVVRMPVNIISARLFSVARPRAAGGVGKRLLTDWRASPPISIRCWSRLMNHPPARLTTRRIAALLKTSGGYRFRDAWLPPRYAPLSL